MRTAIMGAGSLGTILGAYMTKSGLAVDLIDANQAHVDALNHKGATVTGKASFTVPVKAMGLYVRSVRSMVSLLL